ncbi:hypothetical protein EVAR_48290_1 [Eumeta japonica]|uniref:Uncharacterized protein n=1 Tax=Eumeta variegata TaxID=151549 RepID=A0A4C1WNG6_EUMVA|nr:hypothetical protein EVAR_48290_1 [Eumeta japonica]
MRWFLDQSCPFHPILETSHSGKSRNGKERNSPFCVMSSLSAATVVSSTTAGCRERGGRTGWMTIYGRNGRVYSIDSVILQRADHVT